MLDKALGYIENSFLRPILDIRGVTDISYNGHDLFYMDNSNGRMKSDIELTSDQATDFIRQIANLTKQQFSYSDPILDVTVDLYRISAIHHSIALYDGEEVTTFSIRVAKKNLQIEDNSDFFTKPVRELLIHALEKRIPIVIGGETSSGKTELQKYLISKLPRNERVVVIDQVSELDYCHEYAKCDLTIWQSNSERKKVTTDSLLSVSLRNNPDWIIVAETRGEEVINILNSVMTGHSIITTIHSTDAYSIPEKIALMSMMSDKELSYQSVLQDVYYHLPLYVYTKREVINGKIKRFVDSILYITSDGEKHILYDKSKKDCYTKINQNNALLGDISEENFQIYDAFVEVNDEK